MGQWVGVDGTVSGCCWDSGWVLMGQWVGVDGTVGLGI